MELQEVNLAWAHPSQFFTSKGNKQHTLGQHVCISSRCSLSHKCLASPFCFSYYFTHERHSSKSPNEQILIRFVVSLLSSKANHKDKPTVSRQVDYPSQWTTEI